MALAACRASRAESWVRQPQVGIQMFRFMHMQRALADGILSQMGLDMLDVSARHSNVHSSIAGPDSLSVGMTLLTAFSFHGLSLCPTCHLSHWTSRPLRAPVSGKSPPPLSPPCQPPTYYVLHSREKENNSSNSLMIHHFPLPSSRFQLPKPTCRLFAMIRP
jgi:hypothetical protein